MGGADEAAQAAPAGGADADWKDQVAEAVLSR